MRKMGQRARGALLFAVIAVAGQASATITQVDGTILPVSNRLQIFLDAQEGVGVIDAVVDAAEVPQIFKPNLAQPVVFLDVGEGAGFENSFGYYNIGDDVLTPAGRAANLHPILGCGTAMVLGPGNSTTHSGDPTMYVLNAEPGNSISVNFASEQTALRYKGGFIGFYLITPEDPANPGSRLPGRRNCGDFKDDPVPNPDLPLFGRIYYTQKDLNNDGDFVHHLVYSSPVVADRFYFGFEDLFRGGDNDFEDMLIRVDGLTPPCVPQVEICDGLDNDCDGMIDADDATLTGVNDPCTCDGVAMTCDNAPQFGQCRGGVTVCNAATIECHATTAPSPEVCDGADNNCNQLVDDNPSGTGAACDGPDADLCPEGAIVCQGGALVCSDNTGPNVEICNGLNEDCDAATDEGNPGGGGSCGSSLGICTPGMFVCQGGGLVCTGGFNGTGELCNGLDDDCDGVADDNPTDVAQPCGTTSVGECSFGQTICVGGSLSCAGEVGPSPETCNNRDDNCNNVTDDNPVDAGQPCGNSIGECTPGVFVCVAPGMLTCTGGTGPTAEMCNGLDDDCDGVVDDNVPGEGQMCGGGMGACADGLTRCINGAMECVGGATTGTEVCNGIDDDCDGTIDEGDLCNGGICDNGGCAAPCAAGEFPCPGGQVCEMGFCVADPCANVNCPVDGQGNLRVCEDGSCVLACSMMTCPAGLVCRGTDGLCVPDTCQYLPKCLATELCVDGVCTTNPCNGVTCPGDQFCRGGACVASCEGLTCPQGSVCRDGACAPTGCARACPAGQVCNPDTGACQDDMCSAVRCPPTEVCDPLSGQCVPDPCEGVTCPGGQSCELGQCGIWTRGGEYVTVGGGGGCDAGGGAGGGGALLGGLLASGLLLLRRRRTRGLATAALASALLLGGCNLNEFCITCETPGRDAGSGDGGGNGTVDAGGTGCDPNMIRPETCNLIDDDCDGTVDNGFDLQSDELNCGACGVRCEKAGAQTQCTAGACMITGCFPGFSDVNGDITGPYAQSDGCEYRCFQSNGGVEACDTIDNNCNGAVDEGLDLTGDVNNCGSCGRVCEFFQATPQCSNSTCSFTPPADCNPGFLDADGMQMNGCEYSCTPTNGGVEACDVVDNDCDRSVDETFMLQTDRNNCGRCGLVCQFPHVVTTSCSGGMCSFNPATGCQPGFVDVDGQQLDGCEYACSLTNGGIEICDGIDNDCDGAADDNPVDAGASCAFTTPPRGVCVANGMLTCSQGSLVCAGATEPQLEICDNLDQDCNGTPDNGVTQACYTGMPATTNGVGVCRAGTATCAAGMFGACAGEVTPSGEVCNSLDDNCDGTVDNAAGGGPITQSCYSGLPATTAGVGTCRAGTRTCAFGGFGNCVGEVVPRADVCGDNLDTDCDASGDAAEGCLVRDPEQRLDATATQHSYDIELAAGGSPLGTRVYAVWSELCTSTTAPCAVVGQTEVYFRRSTDGGVTWGAVQNLTSAINANAVKPMLVVDPGSSDRVVVAYQTVTGGVRDIRVQASSDSGVSFSAATGALDAAGDSFHHALAIRGTTVVVTWEKLDTTTLARDVMSAASSNGGTSFAAEIRINVGSPATRFAGRPQVGIASSGRTIWVWREQRGTRATRDIFAASSAAAGTAPSADVRVDGDGVTDNRDSDFPVLRVNELAAYLVWQDVSVLAADGSDADFALSTNAGVNWGTERVLDDPAAEVSASFTPTLAVDPRAAGTADDLVAVAWEDRRQGTQVFATVSTNGGTTFSAATRASSNNGGVISGQTSLPRLASAGSGVLAVVYQNQQPNMPPHVFVASSIDSGATWTYTHAQLDGGTGPALLPQVVGSIVASEPAAVAAWTDFRAGANINGDVYTVVAH